MNNQELTNALAAIGWTYVPKSRTAYYPTAAGRIYLRQADPRDYSRLSCSLQFSPRAHVTELSQIGADIAAASHSAAHAAEILLTAYLANTRTA